MTSQSSDKTPKRWQPKPKDDWRAPEHRRMTVDMQRTWIQWSVDDKGRWIPRKEAGKELKVDPRPTIMQPETPKYEGVPLKHT